MIAERLSDILDGVSVIVVLLLILVILCWYYGHKILKRLDKGAPSPDESSHDDR